MVQTDPQVRITELETEVKRLHTLLAHTSDHPIRAKIALWLAKRASGSPVEFHREHKEYSLGTISYHFRVMYHRHELWCSKTRARRGATEHYYALSRKHPLRGI